MQSSSSDTTLASSTDGSGDGVITTSGPKPASTGSEKTSKQANILGKIKKATIGKKSKISQQINDGEDVFRNDPDVKICGE